MKKGLRRWTSISIVISCPFESRPYEEGIKTPESGGERYEVKCLNRDLMKKGLRREVRGEM